LALFTFEFTTFDCLSGFAIAFPFLDFCNAGVDLLTCPLLASGLDLESTGAVALNPCFERAGFAVLAESYII